jgi:uncharacterized membrane protein
VPSPAENYVPQVARRDVAMSRAVAAWALACAGAGAFVALIFVAPLLEARGHGAAGWALRRLFAPLCHQEPERSFYVAGHPLAVCARCAGIYVGFLACMILYPLARSLARTDAPRRAWLFVASLPCVVDFLVNFVTPWHNTHASRAVTGAILGAAAVFYTLPGLVEIAQGFGRSRAARRAVGRDDDGAELGVAVARPGRSKARTVVNNLAN